MKKAVKRLGVLMIASAMLMSLGACGAPAAQTNGEVSSSSSQSQVNSDSGQSSVTSSSSSSSSQTEESDEELGEFNTDATITETVLVDEKGVKITATGLEYTESSADMKLSIENNSGKKLSFHSQTMAYNCNSVNGYMVNDGYLSCEVADGKKANESVSFDFDNMMLYGINEIADIEIGFDISDDDGDYILSGPRQIKTSAFDSHDYDTDCYQKTITSRAAMNTYNYKITHFSEDSLYDEKGVRLLSSGLMVNKDEETILLLELENTTNDEVNITASDIAINGLVVDSFDFSYDEINAGKRKVMDIKISSVIKPEYLSAYGINEIGSVSLFLKQSDADGKSIADKAQINIVVPDVKAEFDNTGKEVYNKGDFRIIAKSVMEDPSEYSSDMYLLLLVENNGKKAISIDDQYDSLSINGVMSDYLFYGEEIESGNSAILKIELDESSLEENKINAPSDIKEIEVGAEIRGDNDTIDEPTIKISFE